ncbi:S5 DRBM domain-containing protein [Plasmodiophora brassicae]|uniref:S5 DRBM domain-containing protein n=1 Tax=Plasmodiophora brassicae TaxID=37360 RepID=A0A0G4IJ29_PLABS|nr:hypothetical protein PBRA_003940 [Plasmodiophora brassicae]SPQ96376.1 unnamed protein product [Plasmodiophora brassicae]
MAMAARWLFMATMTRVRPATGAGLRMRSTLTYRRWPRQKSDCEESVEEMNDFDKELCTVPMDPDELTDTDLRIKPAPMLTKQWLRATDTAIDEALVRYKAEKEGVPPEEIEEIPDLTEMDLPSYYRMMREHMDKLPNMLGGRRPPILAPTFMEDVDTYASPDLDEDFWGARELEEYVDLREDAEELELTGNNPDEEEEEVVASPFGEGGNQGDDDEDIPGIGHCVLSIERKVKTVKSGRIMSISALVVAGNYNGMVGYSIGRGMTSEEAYKTAKRRAAKKMMFVPRLFEESLFHDSIGRAAATKVFLWARRPGKGLVCSPMITEIMELAGIRDATVQVAGSKNKLNVVRAVLDGLSKQSDVGIVRAARGNNVLPSYARLPPATTRLPDGFDPVKTPDRTRAILASLNL